MAELLEDPHCCLWIRHLCSDTKPKPVPLWEELCLGVVLTAEIQIENIVPVVECAGFLGKAAGAKP